MALARERKSARLAIGVLRAVGFEVLGLNHDDLKSLLAKGDIRQAAHEIAGVKPGNEPTWDRVAELLSGKVG